MHKTIDSGFGWRALVLLSAFTASAPALAQQKTGPGITGDDSLTWHGITLYGVIDLGLQYETHRAPFTPYRPAASGNIVRQNSRQHPSNSYAVDLTLQPRQLGNSGCPGVALARSLKTGCALLGTPAGLETARNTLLGLLRMPHYRAVPAPIPAAASVAAVRRRNLPTGHDYGAGVASNSQQKPAALNHWRPV